MKKIKLLCAVAFATLFVSCDANKKKIEEAVKSYLVAVSDDDISTIRELYPNSMSYGEHVFSSFYSFTKKEVVSENVKSEYSEEFEAQPETTTTVDKQFNLNLDEIKLSIDYNEADSTYIAVLNESQKFVVKVCGDTIAIVDSYGALTLDDACLGLAKATGVPVKKMSDIELAELMSEGEESIGDYGKWLSEKYWHAPVINLSGYWNWQGGFYPTCTVHTSIRNDGNQTIKSSDYSVVYTMHGKVTSSRTAFAPDLEPGETQDVNCSINEFYNDAKNHKLSIDTDIKYSDDMQMHRLFKFNKFTGNEYDEFIKSNKETEKK